MGNLGCPKCDRTPVIYSVSSKKWICKWCKHEWQEKESGQSSSPKPKAKTQKKAVKKVSKKLSAKKKKR